VGVQITISRFIPTQRRNSSVAGCGGKPVLHCPPVDFQIQWIVEDVEDSQPEEVDAGDRTLKSGTKVLHPRFTRTHVTVEDVSQDIGAKLEVTCTSKAT
jgi:hypothetical protein